MKTLTIGWARVLFLGKQSRPALSYATRLQKHPQFAKTPIHEPFVIGAIIDLGECLNLTDENALKEVAAAYQALVDMCAADSMPMPQNTPTRQGSGFAETASGLRG